MRGVKQILFGIIFLTPSLALGSDFTGTVVSVIDGDSIRVMHDGQAEQVRLNGIDCPEKGQAFGKRAKQVTSSLVFGKDVSVEIRTMDRFGRTVADVTLPDGISLNRELVKQGWCWWFKKYAPNDSVLKDLETEARKKKLGLWVDAQPVPPWEFRRAKAEKAAKKKALSQQKLQNTSLPIRDISTDRISTSAIDQHLVGLVTSPAYHLGQ